MSEITAYQDNLLGFQTLLAQLGADKGLANYDRANDLETLLKNFVNLNKDTLKSISDLVFAIPDLGPILGPSKSCIWPLRGGSPDIVAQSYIRSSASWTTF